MSVQLLCPACGTINEVHRPPVTDCGHCHVALPAEMRESAERALRTSAAPMPVLLVLGQWLSLFSGAIFVFVVMLAPFDLGKFTINDEAMSGPEFLRHGGWLMGLLGGVLVGIGVGLLRRRAWARELMMLYWVASIGFAVFASTGDIGSMVGSVITMLGALAIAGWYLYRKENVRAYFDSRDE